MNVAFACGAQRHRFGFLLALSKIAIACLAAGTAAQAAGANVGVATSFGTAGAGVHVSTNLYPGLNLRVGTNYYDRKSDFQTKRLEYDASLRLSTTDVLLDYFPFGGGFRVTAGAVWNHNSATAVGVPREKGTVSIAEVPAGGGKPVVTTYPYSSLGVLTSKVTFRPISPYLGLGWGNAASDTPGWGVTGDLGVIFQGAPRVSMAHSNCTAPEFLCDYVRDRMDSEREELLEKANKLRRYPVLRLGVYYRF